MKEHYKERFKYLFHAIFYLFIASALILWSWNTLAELFNWPQAQLRHAAALLVPFAMVVWTARTVPSRHRHLTG
jgi:glycopeptide antibiotics resistance protein